ncbi:hypothetical protein [Kocuria rosea]|nr:hypothetical protein [Kocuria polaris]
MSALRRKQVTPEVFRRIADAIDAMAVDDAAKRTKREIERRSGLSHDAVDRAFKQDEEAETEWHITRRFHDLREGRGTGMSPDRRRKVETKQALADAKEKLKAEERQNERYMMALFAMHLNATEQDRAQEGDVIPMGRNRRPNRWT